MKGAMTRTSEKTGKASGLHNTLVYMRQHWQLYVIFMLPAVLLTVIFRYIPMGGAMVFVNCCRSMTSFISATMPGHLMARVLLMSFMSSLARQ